MDFKKYKNHLKQYLTSKGFNTSNSPMFCFSPDHKNINTPACLIYDDNFNCKSCGIHGDIYDACKILTGITDPAKQFQEIEKTFHGYSPPSEKKKEKFKTDNTSFLKLINYLKNHGGRKKGVADFLSQRGYTPGVAELMTPYLCYWPGFDIAIQEIGKDIIKKSGIPLIHPEKGYSSWSHSGVVLKLATGLKLCFYKDGKCEKRGSKGCYTFPSPGRLLPDTKVILVEAELTAIALRALGFENVFSTGGTNGMTIKSLKEYLLSTKEIIFAFDGDDPGRKASGILKLEKDDKQKNYPWILLKNNYKGIVKIAHSPDLKDPDDLIRENKIDELKEIIENAEIYESKNDNPESRITRNPPFFFLGYDKRAHYILPKNQNIPLRISRGDQSIKNWLKEIAPAEWWLENFYKMDEEGNTSYDPYAAISWFREMSFKRNIYNEDKILGIGVHEDGDDIIFNMGNCLFVSGKELDYNEYTGKNIYCRSKVILKLKGKPWTIEEGINLMRQIKTFSFERPIDYLVIAGFVAIAPFASILKIRPHIWITARHGIGKTTILKTIIVPGVGEKQGLYIDATCSSEAYIRQTCGKDCRVPIIDEFDSNDKASLENNKKILTLIRTAYSGAAAGKGTPDHTPIDFNIKLMFCLASINVRFDNDGDRSRVVVCRMTPKSTNDKNYVKKIENFTGLKLRIFKRIKELNPAIEKAKQIIMENAHNNRTADTYAPFLVGFWMIMSDNSFFQGDEKIQGYIVKSIKEIFEADYRNDEDRILNRIFQERIKIDPSIELTIAEMLTIVDTDMSLIDGKLRYDENIRRYGIRKMISKGESILAIDADHPEIKKILRETPFSDYKEVLQRHPSVIEKSKIVYMSGKNTRCVVFSWKEIHEKYFKEEIDDIPF